ncbi:cache domain-containing sensor histidine kinase [Cohnella herbarum]|uniref:Histidine kinase n=1 Tax=Cohnella herbarum TaxID=2728023 RepID=A0A7Z2ZPL7_9BACL|nr:sensor histidine kinase [Cohnella herbarum]QJD87319.1 histidine kinase [Cohnella herbarum]
MLRKIRSSLKWKLISLIVSIIVAMMVLVGLFSYYDTSRTIRRDVEHFSAQVLRQANLNLNRQYQEYEQGFLVLGTSYEFNQWLQAPLSDRFALISGYQSIERNYMRAFLVRHPEILSVSLLSDKGGEFTYALDAGVSKDYSFAREPWLKELTQGGAIYKRVSESNAYVDAMGSPNPMLLFTLAGRFGKPEAKGYLKMDIAFAPAQAILNEMELGKGGQGFIAGPDGIILVHQDAGQVGTRLDGDLAEHFRESSGSFYRKNAKQLVVFETIPYTNWKTVAIVSNRDVAGSIDRVRVVTVAVTSLGLLVAVVLIAWVTTSVTRRLSQLRKHMKQTRTGNFLSRIDERGSDEVADLGRAFNRMMEELDESVAQLTTTRLMQQKAVLSAMQSQIHSHFLYNALESINSMAHLAGHADIEKTAISLSRMLRYTSNYRDTLVRTDDEIAHVSHYMYICRIRYGENVSFETDIPDDCRAAPCLKAVFQPIAENAVKHGIESTGEPTRLAVTIRLEGDLILASFEDNGTGYDAVRLRSFHARLEAGSGALAPESTSLNGNVGLLNTHYRLRTYYQRSDVGVTLQPGGRLGGVQVIVRYPAGNREIEEGAAL